MWPFGLTESIIVAAIGVVATIATAWITAKYKTRDTLATTTRQELELLIREKNLQLEYERGENEELQRRYDHIVRRYYEETGKMIFFKDDEPQERTIVREPPPSYLPPPHLLDDDDDG